MKKEGKIKEDEISGFDLIPQNAETQLFNICLSVGNEDYFKAKTLFNKEKFSDVLEVFALKIARNYQPPKE